MIDHPSAIQHIADELTEKGTEKVATGSSLGRVLAENIVAPIDHPFFDQSAVDGYAFYFADRDKPIRVTGEVAAGAYSEGSLNPSEAIRIFTGAPVTGGADTVVMQEYTVRTEKNGEVYISIMDEKLKQGGNIRRKGEQLIAGDVTLTRGSIITPSSIGFLASIGIKDIPVYKKISVGIIVSGNEFADNDAELKPGKIYESNGVMLQSALSELGITCNYEICADNQSTMESLMVESLENNDLLIVTGGVSVGDYDFTRPSLEKLGFRTVFHKVKQKPGKPILFVKRDDGKVAFGLPGNPRSAMVCFYMYVLPGIMKMMGSANPGLVTAALPLAHDYRIKEDGKTYFIAAKLVNGEIAIDRKQGSHMMLSMADSNVIAVFPDNKRNLQKGDLVTCNLLSPLSS